MKTFKDRIIFVVGEQKPYSWAAKAGITKGTMSNILKKDGIPNGEQLIRIAKNCGISINWLLLGEGPMFLEDVGNKRDFTDEEKELCQFLRKLGPEEAELVTNSVKEALTKSFVLKGNEFSDLSGRFLSQIKNRPKPQSRDQE